MSHNAIEVNNTKPNITGDISLVADAQFAVFGRGESSAYSNSGATGVSSGDSFYFYDTAPINNITGATFTISNDWCTSFTLPSGDYIVQWSFHLEATASSWNQRLDLKQGGTTKGECIIGSTAIAEQSNGWGIAYLTMTTDTTFSFILGAGSSIDTVANQGTTPSEYGAFYIFKV